ncbi:unnamed protein product [Paramecium octaurelia]|uniref:Cystatin domain-containing protein n=1 Tax=Paramecium octaurelia TaxID=43137 RepID=A0A8S1YAL4_PAROT|nr:unnamed protein product [Paramecium octaurelia]
MIKLLIVIVILNITLSAPILRQQVLASKKAKKEPILDWKSASEYSNNPTYTQVVEVAKKNSSQQCKLGKTVKLKKVLKVAKQLVQGMLWNLQVEFSDNSTKVLKVYEDLDGSFEFDSCKDTI